MKINKNTYRLVIITVFYLLAISCKVNKTKNNMREGRWVVRYTNDSIRYKYIGSYKADEEKGIFRFYANKKRYKKEKYKNGICTTTFYDNGKIIATGHSKSVQTETERHWFYFGDWYYYDKNEKLVLIRKYDDGEIISEIELKNK